MGADGYDTPFGNSRANFYNVVGIPDAWFDGLLNPWPISTWGNAYETAHSQATDVTIDVASTLGGGQTYEVTANICIEPGGQAKTMRIYMAQTLDYWPATPDYHRNGFKQAGGTRTITLSPGQCQDVVWEITIDSQSAAAPHLTKFIVWAQDVASSSPADIHQAAFATADLQAPTPDPMDFLTPPFATGSDSVGMVAMIAGDPAGPVEYYFEAVSGGPGADDSGWQVATAYVDHGLTPNTTYQYLVRARDAASPPNVGSDSPTYAATTRAEVPPAPLVGNSGATTLDVDPEAGSNPAGTEFAIDCSSVADVAWDGYYVDASGNPSVTAVWQTDAAWGTVTVNGLLEGGIEYCVGVQARNSEGVESNFSPTTCGATLADPQTIVSARSCMDHVGQRWCLNLDGGGIEPRWNPRQLEFDLTGNVAGAAATLDCASGNGGPATVTVGAGLNGPQSMLTIDFAAVPNVDCCTVTLTGGAEDAFDFQVLAGDVNSSGSVNATDKNLVKGNLNKPLDAAKFVFDINATGLINATDKNLTKGWIGNTAATCP
ncbi:MAG: hypothetical protein GY778_22915 [bacterium]|nr:hypothetical protein [bacterium]